MLPSIKQIISEHFNIILNSGIYLPVNNPKGQLTLHMNQFYHHNYEELYQTGLRNQSSHAFFVRYVDDTFLFH